MQCSFAHSLLQDVPELPELGQRSCQHWLAKTDVERTERPEIRALHMMSIHAWSCMHGRRMMHGAGGKQKHYMAGLGSGIGWDEERRLGPGHCPFHAL